MLRTLKALVLVASSITGCLTLASEAPPAGGMAGNADAGASKAIVCAACHGQEGQAILPAYPNLGGQHYGYLVDQMQKFRSGERYAVLMAGQADNLSDEDIADIAAFFASKPNVVGEADGALELGARIYQAGLADKGVPACTACHSPRGLGNGPAKFPMLSGQHSEYVALQLKAYRDGERQTDESVGQMMRGVAANLNDREIEAVSAYVRGLH